MFLTLLLGITCSAQTFGAKVELLSCEFLENPLGIDARNPRLSWVLSSNARGEKQSAYEIMVASSEKKLAAHEGDLWSSGKVASDKSIHVNYAGKSLPSRQECFWKVRVWDNDGKPSAWSKPAQWSMGLLDANDWKAQWIGQDGTDSRAKLEGASWIWFPEGNPADKAPVGKRWFRKVVTLPPDRKVTAAQLFATADNHFVAYINGQKLGEGANFKAASGFDVLSNLRPGTNVLAIVANNTGEAANPAGAIALLRVNFSEGKPLLVPTDATWKTTDKEQVAWQKAEHDDTAWIAAKNLGAAGIGPWGEIGAPEDRYLPARYLRKEFSVDKRVKRATAYISGLGLSELHINGQRISDHVLSPGLTEYNKRVLYVTHDVTSQIKSGANAVGVILGNGRYYAPRLKVPTETLTYGFPKLLFQLHVDYMDGSSATIVSDGSWKLSSNGPIRGNNEYDGEDYDARLEMAGWHKASFDDASWQLANAVQPPGGKLEAQMIEPIRVTETLKPVSMKEVKPGVYVYDLGQNMVGWCRVKVSGPSGTQIKLRYAEILKPDGTIYLDNIRSAKVTSTYTSNGGTADYEPSFTYFGFRYVELTGYPGKPTLSTIEGRVVHDDIESTGEFTCSNPLLNQIWKNVRWGLRGNYRSLPTDCPQRDERQGWLGDRAFESKGETYMFNTAALYAKWLRDMADGQKDNGSLSDVCPAYWPLYSDNVTWPSASVIMPSMLYEQFGDAGIIATHYASMKKWMEHMGTFMKDGIIEKDSYGDWCVPPEEQSLIHSKDPKRQTSRPLLATSYYYNNCRLMERYAALLDKKEDAKHYRELAATIKTAFNNKFLNKERGQYDNGTQTSCVLPLAFGLVPDDQRQRVVQTLIKNIQEVTHGHIGTGLVGGQWLNRVLSDNGHADVVYTMATKTNYPSWGYMISKGATTIWELWNGDTADPAMNSGNHLMLVGDLMLWLHEYVAGIKSDPAQPGFKHIIMKPHLVGDLEYAKASHRSPYGLIVSDWKKDGAAFQWKVSVPPNTTATVYVPVSHPQHFTSEGGKPISANPHVKHLRREGRWETYQVAAGNYYFENKHSEK